MCIFCIAISLTSEKTFVLSVVNKVNDATKI